MPPDADFARRLFGGACEFVAGAANIEALPPSSLPEIAFVGRSNAGKSSLINALTNRTSLARVSRTPGRTRQINLFRLQNLLILADLPGYGFARISKHEAADWDALISGYLHTRKTLRRVMLLVDARRGIMETDRAAMALLDVAAVGYMTVLTKIDCVKAAELEEVQNHTRAELQTHAAALPDLIATSAKAGSGLLQLRAALAEIAAG
jgi:GTP-binding protein